MNGLVVELSTCEIRKDAALIAYHPPHEKLVFKMSSRYEHAKNNIYNLCQSEQAYTACNLVVSL